MFSSVTAVISVLVFNVTGSWPVFLHRCRTACTLPGSLSNPAITLSVVEISCGKRDCLFLAAAANHEWNVVTEVGIGQRLVGVVASA